MTPPAKRRECGPVRAELELHRYAGDDAEQKDDAKDLGPESGCLIPAFVLFPYRQRLENYDHGGKPHRQLREQVMIGDRKGKMDTIERICVHILRIPLCLREKKGSAAYGYFGRRTWTRGEITPQRNAV